MTNRQLLMGNETVGPYYDTLLMLFWTWIAVHKPRYGVTSRIR